MSRNNKYQKKSFLNGQSLLEDLTRLDLIFLFGPFAIKIFCLFWFWIFPGEQEKNIPNINYIILYLYAAILLMYLSRAVSVLAKIEKNITQEKYLVEAIDEVNINVKNKTNFIQEGLDFFSEIAKADLLIQKTGIQLWNEYISKIKYEESLTLCIENWTLKINEYFWQHLQEIDNDNSYNPFTVVVTHIASVNMWDTDHNKIDNNKESNPAKDAAKESIKKQKEFLNNRPKSKIARIFINQNDSNDSNIKSYHKVMEEMEHAEIKTCCIGINRTEHSELLIYTKNEKPYDYTLAFNQNQSKIYLMKWIYDTQESEIIECELKILDNTDNEFKKHKNNWNDLCSIVVQKIEKINEEENQNQNNLKYQDIVSKEQTFIGGQSNNKDYWQKID